MEIIQVFNWMLVILYGIVVIFSLTVLSFIFWKKREA